MEAQEKVKNKIKGSLKHGNEGQLGTKKNDECYTSMTDINRELQYWANLGKFQGKNIICPCDWDIVGNKTTNEYGVFEYKGKTYTNVYGITITYDTNKFNIVGNNVYKCVEKVIICGEEVVINDPNSPDSPSYMKPVAIEIAEEDMEEILRNKLTCNFIRTLTQNARKWGIKSITASGYNPAANNNKGAGIPFQQVDYTKYDICITNPPFSLYSEFMDAIVGKIDFIVLAPLTNRALIATVVPLMEKTAYLGHGIELHMNFQNPTKENQYHTKVVNSDWITSFPEAQQERNNEHFKSGVSYELYKDEYEEMKNMTMKDDTHPIRVSMSTYPDDYDGWMFATIGVLDNLDQDTYEWYSTNCYKYFNQTYPEKNPMKHNFNADMYICKDGGKAFSGVLFRKKPVSKD